MSNQARALDIAAFISEVKRLLSTGKYENEILGLTVGDYYKGPKQDLDPNRPGDIWEFEKDINGTQFYVKVKITKENGYRAFDYDKFCAMVLFFAHKSTELLKTKLMKLLNYSDMIFYKENGISISGARYAHLPYGPVPENFDILLGTMAADHIAHIEVVYDNGYEKHQVIAEEDMPEDVLSKEELAVLNRIYYKFVSFGSADISNYSHKEKGYMETQKGEIISYSYAKYIELN